MAQSQISSSPKALHERTAYKWIALSNTTLGVLMAAINGSSLIIALPAVFRGIHVNPLATGQTSLLLWVLMGYNVATTILLLAFGRLSDSLGRVRLYNLGFAIFTAGSILLSLTWGHGIDGEWQLIIFRFVQGIGGAFLYANSTAILTDAFPPKQRGLALGLNGVAALAGATLGSAGRALGGHSLARRLFAECPVWIGWHHLGLYCLKRTSHQKAAITDGLARQSQFCPRTFRCHAGPNL